jgi:DNA-binding protein Fis
VVGQTYIFILTGSFSFVIRLKSFSVPQAKLVVFFDYSKKYALVGFPSIAKNAKLLCDLLQYQIAIFTVEKPDEVSAVLQKVSAAGYEMVLCDVSANSAAKVLGLNALLITSGTESISSAFDEAVKISLDYNSLQTEKLFFIDLLQGGTDKVLVMDENGEVFFSTADANDTSILSEKLRPNLTGHFEKKPRKFYLNTNGVLYSFTCRHLSFQEKRYVAFYFSKANIPPSTNKYGIQYANQQETEDQFFNSFFSLTNANQAIRSTLQNINLSDVPVMICGEPGTGKEQVARAIYSRSPFAKNPMVTINCTLLNDRSWNFLLNHHKSPFADSGNTIYFKDISQLSSEYRSLLLSNIIDSRLCKRNRVLFSCRCPMGQGIPDDTLEFVNLLSCVTLHLPPLREHVGEIPTLTSLYLSVLNGSMENQIIGVEPEAMALLQCFEWPYNYTQFKRILNELALATTTPYIQTSTVATVLREEKKNIPISPVPPVLDADGEKHLLDLSRPLKDIIQDVVEIVLSELDGNQSATAKRLGIGRSTLWRYLK